MNPLDHAGRSLLQRLLDYRNRAEELRMIAENMREEPAVFMLSAAAAFDGMADTVHAILLHSAEPANYPSTSPPSTGL